MPRSHLLALFVLQCTLPRQLHHVLRQHPLPHVHSSIDVLRTERHQIALHVLLRLLQLVGQLAQLPEWLFPECLEDECSQLIIRQRLLLLGLSRLLLRWWLVYGQLEVAVHRWWVPCLLHHSELSFLSIRLCVPRMVDLRSHFSVLGSDVQRPCDGPSNDSPALSCARLVHRDHPSPVFATHAAHLVPVWHPFRQCSRKMHGNLLAHLLHVAHLRRSVDRL
mmetsp:Transcript_3591/g.11286  ORF Transcript_3591/g.11286 Transcript_3591/m.11286 type:complete len:221 (+) Transcript_3591:68-730(+)